MKCAVIHQGLEQQEIRDLLARQLRGLWLVSSNPEGIQGRIKQLEIELEQAKTKVGILALIKHLGWEEWDVSDEVSDYGEHYFPFLGTRTELDAEFPDAYD